MSSTTVSLYLDKRRALKDGTFPVKISIINNRTPKLYSTNISLSEDEWEKTFNTKRANQYQQIKLELEALKAKAIQIVQVLREKFSFEEFEEVWFGKSKRILDKPNVFVFIEDRINALRIEERENTAVSYQNTLSALKAFKDTVTFEEISVQFLKDFERFMLQRGNSLTTIGIYMRTFKAILNLAIAEKFFKQENYPFGKTNRGYIDPKGTGTKDFLTEDEFRTLRNFETEVEQEAKARDFFVFSCLANGLNFKDICLLKYRNIKDNTITVIREKTKNTTRNKPSIVRISMTQPMWDIINKWGTPNQYPDDYVFGVLEQGLSETEISKDVKQYIKTTNKYLKRIKEKLGFKVNLTTMVARHTFATILLRKGASKEFLQESFAHGNILTTENYTKGFSDETRMKWANALLE